MDLDDQTLVVENIVKIKERSDTRKIGIGSDKLIPLGQLAAGLIDAHLAGTIDLTADLSKYAELIQKARPYITAHKQYTPAKTGTVHVADELKRTLQEEDRADNSWRDL